MKTTYELGDIVNLVCIPEEKFEVTRVEEQGLCIHGQISGAPFWIPADRIGEWLSVPEGVPVA